MKLITFSYEGSAQAGVLQGSNVIGLRSAGYPDAISAITAGRAGIEKAAAAGEAIPLARVKLLAPVPKPPKIICVGLDYRDHAIESKMEIPAVPTIFSKYATSVIGPGESIVLPKNSAKPDYEGEFAFIVGRRGRHVPASAWRDYVFGYTILNDVSARDFQMATSQWMMGKTFDTFAPIGPWIVTADEIEDP